MEKVDVLAPPDFAKTGEVKPVIEAIEAGDWLGTFNLWVVQRKPKPAVIYQLRPEGGWAPNTLDVSAGGYYAAGEELLDGLREAKEELGRDYEASQVTYLGRRINVSRDSKDRERKTVVQIYLVEDNSELAEFKLDMKEVPAIFRCPLDELLKCHREKGYNFEAEGIRNDGTAATKLVNSESFPYNWDNYHYKMALVIERFMNGQSDLLY